MDTQIPMCRCTYFFIIYKIKKLILHIRNTSVSNMGTCMPPFCLWTGPTVTWLLRAAASSPPRTFNDKAPFKWTTLESNFWKCNCQIPMTMCHSSKPSEQTQTMLSQVPFTNFFRMFYTVLSLTIF